MNFLEAASLRTKLLAVVMLTTLAALAVALAAIVAYDVRDSHAAWVADMSTQAEMVGQAAAPALAFDDAKVADETLRLLQLRPQMRAAAIYLPGDRLFASILLHPDAAPPPPRLPAPGVHVGAREVEVVRRVMQHGDVLGTVYLRAEHRLDERLLTYGGIALGSAALAMAVALLLSLRLQRLVTRPLLAVAAVAREVVDRRDYSRRVERLSRDEVGTLVDAFNDMLAEIERRVAQHEASLREIQHLNEQLEQRVRERTQQLETSNQELLRATEAAEQANRAKSDFISSMSHELRTPLNAILGFGQLLAAEGMVTSPQKQREYTRHILKAGSHLLSLINEILDLARIESSNLMLSPEPVGLAEVLNECRSMVEASAQARGVRLLFPPPAGLHVQADRTRLKQVLLNLMSNAVKYNREGGAVMVECAPVGDGERVRLSVQDTGLGLNPEQVQKLFQPFNRLGQEAGPQEGTGIGLVVSKRLVELMGGEIGVSSSPGIGSVFWVELPATSQFAAASDTVPGVLRPLAEGVPAADRPQLLCIEDNPASLRLIEEMVEARGDLQTLSAPDARLGLELARMHRPAVILMDLNLPQLSGADALELLAADPTTAGIPVIAVTANARPRDIVQGLNSGFFRYVTKPVGIAELNQAIDDALRSNWPPA